MNKRFYKPGRLYFFPAFLPLIEIVPWLITLISVVVATASFSLPIFLKKNKKSLTGLGLACCLVGAYAYTKTIKPQKPVPIIGTRLVDVKDFPVVKILRPTQAAHNANLPSFQKKWHQQVDHHILSYPVIYNQALIYGSYKGSVEAVSLFNGQRIWSLPQDTYTMSISQDEQGNVYAGEGLHDTEVAALTSFNTIEKKVNWRREFTGHIESMPIIDQRRNKVWVTTGPGGLWAVDKADASVLLHLPIGHIDNAPLIHKDRVYAQAQKDEDGALTILYALSESDGDVIWELPLQGEPWGSPQIDKDENVIFTTSGEGQIGVNNAADKGWAYAISVSGEVLWQKELPGMAIQPSIYIPSENLIINTIKSGEIVALDAANGLKKWQVKAGETFMSSAILISDFGAAKIASVSEDGQFSIRDAKTGAVLISEKVGDGSSSAPIVHGDTIYVLSAFEIVAFGGLNALWEK